MNGAVYKSVENICIAEIVQKEYILRRSNLERKYKMIIYMDIYKSFLEYTNINESLINDWRPCTEIYNEPWRPNTIIVWLKNGSKIIYTIPEIEKG